MRIETAYTVESYFSEGYNFSGDIDGETIARYISVAGKGPRWLDLGCGPCLPLWAMFNPNAEHIVGADLNSEAIVFLRRMIRARELSQPIRAAASQAVAASVMRPCLSEDDLAGYAFDRIRELIEHNVMVCNPQWIEAFDFVTQIGCFGCLANLEQFGLAARHAYRYLVPSGTMVSVTWAQSHFDGVELWNGPVSARVSVTGLRTLFEEAGFVRIAMETHQTAAAGYDQMIVAILEK